MSEFETPKNEQIMLIIIFLQIFHSLWRMLLDKNILSVISCIIECNLIDDLFFIATSNFWRVCMISGSEISFGFDFFNFSCFDTKYKERSITVFQTVNVTLSMIYKLKILIEFL